MFTKITEYQKTNAENYVAELIRVYDTQWLDWYTKYLSSHKWWWISLTNFFRLPKTDKHYIIQEIWKQEKLQTIADIEKGIVAEMSHNKNIFIKDNMLWKLEASNIKYKLLSNNEFIGWGRVAIIGIPYEKKEIWSYDMKIKFWKTMAISQKKAPNLYKDIITTYEKYVNDWFMF
jgi:hypothetical protein